MLPNNYQKNVASNLCLSKQLLDNTHVPIVVMQSIILAVCDCFINRN